MEKSLGDVLISSRCKKGKSGKGKGKGGCKGCKGCTNSQVDKCKKTGKGSKDTATALLVGGENNSRRIVKVFKSAAGQSFKSTSLNCIGLRGYLSSCKAAWRSLESLKFASLQWSYKGSAERSEQVQSEKAPGTQGG
jgi:hypothetical protein